MPDERKPVSELTDEELSQRLLELTRQDKLRHGELQKLAASLAVERLENYADYAQKQLETQRIDVTTFRNYIVHYNIAHHGARPVAPAKTPPRIVEGVFWLLLPRKVRDAIMGDAAEAYNQTIERYNGRRWMATLDYIKEAAFAMFAAFRMSFAQWVQLIWKRSS